MASTIRTPELKAAEQHYAEAVKTALTGAGLSKDQQVGALSGLLSSLWNRLEADLQKANRKGTSRAACR